MSISPAAAAAAAKLLQSCPTLCNPIDSSPPGFPVPGILQARILKWVAMLSSRRIFPTQVSLLQADSLSSEPPGKSKNTGVGSLSLLQGTFLIQESNRGLLHCRLFIYQPSHQGSPLVTSFSLSILWSVTPPELNTLIPASNPKPLAGSG